MNENTNNPVKLSVVIITYNEERNIERCLSSVAPIADEIVVLDSFSTDRTKEICQKAGARFFQHPFDGHIEQKNRAISYASFPHVLSLDADEALSPQLCESVRQAKQNFSYDGYFFNRLTRFCGKWIRHTGWYPDRKLRLWDRRRGKWGGTNPHDKYIMQPGTKTAFLKGDLWHFSFYSIAEHVAQINKFSEIKATQAFKKGKKASWAKILLSPVFKFFKHFVLKAGFLDGFYGLVISCNSAHSNFLKYIKLRQLYAEKNKHEQ